MSSKKVDFVKGTRVVAVAVQSNFYALPPKTMLLMYVYPYLSMKEMYLSGAIIDELS